MTTLAEAIRRGGVLPGLPVPGWLGRLLDLAELDLSSLVPVPYSPALPMNSVQVVIDREAVRAEVGVTLSGDAHHAVIVVSLWATEIVLGGGDEPLTLAGVVGGDGRLVLGVDDAGRTTASIAGDAALSVTGSLRLPGPGGVVVELEVSEAALEVVDSGPRLRLRGSLAVTGLPLDEVSAPGSGTAPRVDVWLTWGADGVDGGVEAPTTFAGPLDDVVWELGWAGNHVLCPSSLSVDLPLHRLPGLGQRLHGRMRVLATPDAGGRALSMQVELTGGEGGLVESDDGTAALAAIFLAANAGGTVTQPDSLVGVAAVVATARVLTELLDAEGRVQVTHAVLLLQQPDRVAFDYEAEVLGEATAGPLSVRTTAPMRASVRGVEVTWSGGLPRLEWRGASIDVTDPGQWEVTRPRSGPLQVDRVRSGTGSQWFEVDLRFALDLGPVEVDGATVRLTLPSGGNGFDFSMRGFGVRLAVPGLVSARGSLGFGGEGASSGLHAAMQADIRPLGLTASAELAIDPRPGYTSLVAGLAFDLPSPIPLANTGLGLFGVVGAFGLNRDAAFPDDFAARLDWDPMRGSRPRRGSSMVGLGVAVGTLPDLGHGFSALGRVAVTTPSLAVIAAVSGRLLANRRPSVTDPPGGPPGAGPQLRGVLAVIPEKEVSLSVVAQYAFPDDSSWKLIEAVAPVEAVWLVGPSSPGWYVHLGTDRSRQPGPVRAAVLPGILPRDLLRAEAFLMVHGDGLTGLPVSTAEQGLVVAAGIDVAATLVCLPAVAEVWARGTLAVSTHPVFVTGRATVGGRLRLGPFSLGVDAGMDLQVGPGSTYSARLRICGEIDLWLVEISGCVHISLGHTASAELEPAVSPVVSLRVSDQRGAADPRTPSGAVPVCWPDGVVQVGFAPAPAGALPPPGFGPPQQFHINPGFSPRGRSGCAPGYQVSYRLTSLSLGVDGGLGAPYGLPATWQTKPGQGSVPGDGAATLALLTEDSALWTHHTMDGGAKDVSQLPQARARECRGEGPEARPGWALGQDAVRTPAGTPPGAARWSLPAHPTLGPASGLQSTVRVRELRTTWPAAPPRPSVEAGPAGRSWLPVGVVPLGSGVAEQPSTRLTSFVDLDVAPRAHLVLPDVLHHAVDREIPPDDVVTALVLEDALVSQQLLVLRSSLPLADSFVTSPTPSGVLHWRPVDAWEEEVGWLSMWDFPHQEPAEEVVVRHPRLTSTADAGSGPDPDAGRWGIAVVGIRGVTSRAESTASTARNGRPLTHPTPLPPRVAPPGWRPPLQPGSRHRLRVGWSAHATAGALPGRDTYGEDQLVFDVADGVVDRPPSDRLMTATDVFHPAMLVRYVRGYDPDGSVPWFTDDPVAVVVERSAIGVAHAYDLNPTLVVTATDERLDVPVSQLDTVAEEHTFLRPWELDALVADGPVALGCALPHGPVRLQARAGLLPGRAYDLTLDHERGPTAKAYAATALPPVAFRTSRWSGPAALFASVGFGLGPSAAALVARQVLPGPLRVLSGDDGTDQAVRAALGDAVIAPRHGPVRATLLLTAASPDVSVAGLLLECAEPILRGRALGALTLRADGGQVWARVVDRCGSTVLFAAPVGTTPTRLRLEWTRWGTAEAAEMDVVRSSDDSLLAALSQDMR